MSERFFVTDTHPFVWYMSKQFTKLPAKVLKVFHTAKEEDHVHIWVPQITLWEISVLLKKTARLTIKVSLQELVREQFYAKSISVIDLDTEDIMRAHSMTFVSDPFDALIMACAQRLKVPLITADRKIHDSEECEVFW